MTVYNQERDFLPVSVSGAFWTGSGAVIDLLSEHRDCTIIPDEFTLFSHGQFFEEVFEVLLAKKSIEETYELNIRRFKEFNQSELPIILSALRYFCSKFGIFPRWLFARRIGMSKILGKKYLSTCQQLLIELKSAMKSEEYFDLNQIRLIIINILIESSKALNHRKELPIATVFDQMVAPPYVSSAWAALPNLRVICVDRDWRDQYVELRGKIARMVRVKKTLKVTIWGLQSHSDDWRNPVSFFVRLRKQIDSIKTQQIQEADKRLIWIDFEDIINDTENTVKVIFDFLGLDGSRWKSYTHFFPNKSIANIGKWRNSKYLKEIKLIEEQIGLK
ncbi:MAG: sulfotransferase [Candidatus Marinimicrobia bacterium]|nr:sulfotransferase [Candidatus Neomarinimicrobiota bacterium]